jgi:hypothetical protein
VTCFYTLLHAAGEGLRADRTSLETAVKMLTRSLRDLIVAPAAAEPPAVRLTTRPARMAAAGEDSRHPYLSTSQRR